MMIFKVSLVERYWCNLKSLKSLKQYLSMIQILTRKRKPSLKKGEQNATEYKAP